MVPEESPATSIRNRKCKCYGETAPFNLMPICLHGKFLSKIEILSYAKLVLRQRWYQSYCSLEPMDSFENLWHATWVLLKETSLRHRRLRLKVRPNSTRLSLTLSDRTSEFQQTKYQLLEQTLWWRYIPIYADCCQVEDRCSATHHIKRDPSVTQWITELPHAVVHLHIQ